MIIDCAEQLRLWDLGTQPVTVDFAGGELVTDAGLLAIRALDKELGVLAELAERFPDPRAQRFVTHSREAILTQQVYQILAGYADGNDAQSLRHDPLFQTVADVSPAAERPLASGSTLNRFHQGYTRREADLPADERTVDGEVNTALTQCLKVLNDYLPALFSRTRRQAPAAVVIDLDPSDDPTHGQQVLTGFHGYYEQHQYFPLFAFDGDTGFPLAAWLRPGTVHASAGAVEALQRIETHLRVEERTAGGPPVVPPFSGQRAQAPGTCAGLRIGGAASRSDGGHPRRGPRRSRHAAPALVESGRGGPDERAADLVPLLRQLAESHVVAGSAGGTSRLA